MQQREFAPWVRDALKRAKIGQAELARRLTESLGRSIDRAAVNKMVSGGRDLAADELLMISEITGVPVPGTTNVPLLDWVSAGRLVEPSSQIPVEDIPLLAFADLGRGDYFALKVQGTSMDRLSPEGSTIIVNRADRELVSGKPYVFLADGETTYKRWQGGDPPYLEPHSWDGTHKPIFIKRKRDVQVVGRVRRTLMDLD